jgi:diguanylate cyclase (GGDEF)-like protein/PAS domain S-box-containing protein
MAHTLFNLLSQASITRGVSSVPDPGPDRRQTDAGDACRAALEPDALLDALVEQEAVGITIVDRDLRVVRANRAFGIFGDETPDQVAGRLIGDALPRLASQIVPDTLAVLRSGVPSLGQEVVAGDPDDPENCRWFRAFRSPVISREGEIVGVTSTVIEISDLKRAQHERDDAVVRKQESDAAEHEALLRYRTIFDCASMGILRAHRSGRLVEANPAIERMLGYSAAELKTMQFREYTHPDDIEQNLVLFREIMDGTRDAYQYEKRCIRKDGSLVWIRLTSVAELGDDGARDYSITMFEDITERKLAEQMRFEQAKLNEHQALHDALTGLANRRKLYVDVERALNAGGGATFAIALFDLDGFKAYNDVFGHPAGDTLLARLGHRLSDAMADQGMAYRMGGDEFCVFTWGDETDELVEAARVALCDQGDGFAIRCSCGSAVLPSEAATLDRAIQLADERLYRDKRANKVSDSLQVRDALVQLIAEQRKELGASSINVADLAAATATILGLSPDDVACTRIAAQLHDIGKTAVPEAILSKPGPLDSEEWDFMRRHTLIGERIVAAAPALARIAPIVRASHERPDGNGYPDGLMTEAIPIGARIVAVVDAFSAMVSSRPYKPAMTIDGALLELRRCAGTQFDPSVVDAFARVIEQPLAARRAA